MACKTHPTWTADDDCIWCENASLTRERDSLELELRATESVRVKDNGYLIARAEKAEGLLREVSVLCDSRLGVFHDQESLQTLIARISRTAHLSPPSPQPAPPEETEA